MTLLVDAMAQQVQREKLEEKLEKVGDLTMDMGILPTPEFFEERVKASAQAHTKKITDSIVKNIKDSEDGQLTLDLGNLTVPPMWHDYVVATLRKWASMHKYNITFFYTDKDNCKINKIFVIPKTYVYAKRERNLHLRWWALRVFPCVVVFSSICLTVVVIIETQGVHNPGPFMGAFFGGFFAIFVSFAFCWDWAKKYKQRYM